MFANKPLLTRKEAAEALSISVRKVDYLIASGDIPAVRLGRKTVRIRPSAVNYLIEANEQYGRSAQ